MAYQGSQSTAENVVGSIDAVVSFNRPIGVDDVARFLDTSTDRATAALDIAEALRMVASNSGLYSINSPLCRLFATSSQTVKAALLRIAIEPWDVFQTFINRFQATSDLTQAAKQVKAQYSLFRPYNEIQETMVSLGTFSQALRAGAGGKYQVGGNLLPAAFNAIAQQSINLSAAEERIKIQIGATAETVVDKKSVLEPLANALVKANVDDPRGAILESGNAVESYLVGCAPKLGVILKGTGLNAKAEELKSAGKLPMKLHNISKYLGHIRNAADHGIDSETGFAWEFHKFSGLEYVYVSCSFIRATTSWWSHNDPTI